MLGESKLPHRPSKIGRLVDIKDAGIAIHYLQGDIISMLQGPEMGWRRWASLPQTKSEKVDNVYIKI